MTLEDILQKHFSCKKPFLKTPVKRNDLDGYGHRYLTLSGERAYGNLIALLYDLDELCPNVINVHELVEDLDSIADGIEY